MAEMCAVLPALSVTLAFMIELAEPVGEFSRTLLSRD